uniref:Uncharacterized protein n=1 Tax=Dulem virus 33 TaxID=3145751 RepID=A0AAU8B6D8_9CAUD
MSLSSDTALTMPVVPAGMAGSGYGGSGGNGLFGNDGALWLIVLFLFIFAGGWGNGNWGGNNGGGSQGYDTRADIQRSFDNSAVVTKLDGITQGICDATYALNNTMTTGFVNAELSRCNQQAALMQQLNAMAMQSQQCCCDTREAIQGVNYNLATQGCDTRNTIQNTTRDIIDNQNANARAVLDALTAQRIEAKDEKIAELQSLVNSLNLAQSQANQNTYLVNTLRPSPIPAYPACNPWAGQAAYGSCGCA